MVKKITILGSTGSIGRQTLQVVDQFPGKLQVTGLSAGKNIELLAKQIRKYKPLAAAIQEEKDVTALKKLTAGLQTEIFAGEKGLTALATQPVARLVVVALVGFSGLKPTLAALRAGKQIALANKESLVVGGELLMAEARLQNTVIRPVDSEHAAIFQCLQAGAHDEVKKIILTASGGPFRGWQKKDLAGVLPAQALQHPNWKMGAKVTVDSATLMNKGLEVLEARWLFDLQLQQIEVVVHPESIVHSMVEYVDGSVVAQLGFPSMLFPIQYALSYPERWANNFSRLGWGEKRSLNFEPPDLDTFPCLRYAYQAGELGGTMPAVLNAANEIAVEKFLEGQLPFLHIPVLLEKVLGRHSLKVKPTLEEIMKADAWAREEAAKVLK
ncbi:MAG: 1-deoxy-D-xylulose-5-phosphate reductoisomerase [Firmicutes bacterium]|nr:1-deoxy-D-xylulose-5-phosphate reductoisomerase [Bacillota bacterium]